MIQPAMQICREKRWETLSMLVSASLALFLPMLLVVLMLAGRDAAQGWLVGYNPVIYLNYDVSEEAVSALALEVEGWSTVETVKVRKPSDALKDLEGRLGVSQVRELGVSSSMLPASIVVEPSAAVVGHIDLVSRIVALEARMEVHSVQVPDSAALRVLSMTAMILTFAAILGLLGLIAFGLIMGEFLYRLQVSERNQNDVLAIFGASGAMLRRPTLLRGMVLGAWVGGLTAIGLSFSLVMIQGMLHAMMGVSLAMLGVWPLVAVPLLLGPMFGLGLAVLLTKPSRRPTQLVPRLLNAYGV